MILIVVLQYKYGSVKQCNAGVQMLRARVS